VSGWQTVRVLAATSLLMDVSGEMVTALLPFVLAGAGASGLAIGFVAALSEAIGHLSKWVGGRLGDRIRRQRPLVAAGYLGAALARVGLATATAWPAVLGWRSLDRIGKGMRTAPRDAILSQALPARERGRAFAFHRAADTAGAVLGILLLLALLAWTRLGPGGALWVAAVAGLAAALPLAWLKEPTARPRYAPDERPHPSFRAYVAVGCLVALFHAAPTFFLLRAGSDGILPAVGWYLLFNVTYAAGAYPIGAWADQHGKPRVLAAGCVLLALACVLLAWSDGPLALGGGFFLLGLGFAASEGTGRALAADLAGSRTGTALGVYHAAAGLAALAGGLAGGALLDAQGPAWLFGGFAAAGAVAAVAVVAWQRLSGAPGVPTA
jgi:MFS family permease